MRRRQAGFSLLEFGVASTILGVLALILLDRLSFYQEWAEKANMEYTAAAVKSALRFRVSSLMVEGRMREIPVLEQQNPIDWLEQKPANYLGEFDGDPPAMWSHGGWYYDKRARTLVYRAKQGRYFVPDSRSRKEVRFRMMTVYDKSPEDVGAGASPMAPSGGKLVLVEPYQWF